MVRGLPRWLGLPLQTAPAFARSSSSFSSSRLEQVVASHYASTEGRAPVSDYAEQARQELRWLKQAARARADKDGEGWQDRLEVMVKEIVELDKPLAYVLGTQPFHPLPVELIVRPPTLIPRPETEHWIQSLQQRIATSPAFGSPSSDTANEPFRVLDIGTGTGCIALSLAYGLDRLGKRPVHVLAADRANAALELATENARRCGLLHGEVAFGPTSPSHVAVLKADVFSPAFTSDVLSALPPSPLSPTPRFDLVVSNPPYIPLHEYTELDRSVREWEDRGALVGELPSSSAAPPTSDDAGAADDGLVFYRRIASLLRDLLAYPTGTEPSSKQRASSSPIVAFEVGQGQARAVQRLLEEAGYKADVLEDPWGIERAVFAYRHVAA